MSIDKSKYKDISFYSEFGYLNTVYRGSVTSVDNGSGSYIVNETIAMPDAVTQRPPYIDFFIENPTGYFRRPGAIDTGFYVGWDEDNIYFNNADVYDSYGNQFKIHYIIYGAKTL